MSQIKAIVCKTTVKHKRKEIVNVIQFCNDWFMLDDSSIVSPVCLAFKPIDIHYISNNNPGFMFNWYEMINAPEWCNEYIITFKKKKINYDRSSN